jgi:N-methylhydantoinase A
LSTNGHGKLRVAVDIGGTFTDFVVLDAKTGEFRVGKLLSNPRDPVAAVVAGLDGLSVELQHVEFLVHGTTVGINAVVEGRGADVALVTTEGFRDVLEIGLMDKKEMYDLFYRRPPPLVPRRRRFEVAERIDGAGRVATALDDQRLEAVTSAVRESEANSVAVVTINAYLNPEHEEAIGRRLSEALGSSVLVSLSHQIANEWREYERTATTVLNAYVLPVMQRYLGEVRERLSARGLDHEVYIMRSSGGIMTASAASVRPIHALLSGPVGGAVGAQAIARRGLGRRSSPLENVVAADMGGTSFDASLIVGGEIEADSRAEVAGYPLLASTVRVRAIGAGGGSIARAEGGRGLRVGPESAGASPGPACYGRGGIEPTVTDANLVLGRLGAADVLGGEIALDLSAAERAIRERVADPLGLDVHEAAEGILRVVASKMALAIRELTVARGIDPRDFVLLAFGGAGPMHAAEIGAEIGIRTIVVPPVPGMFSAWGMLAADVRHELVRTAVGPASALDRVWLENAFRSLEDEARETLAAEGVDEERMRFIRSLDLRYAGQEHTLSVPAPLEVEPAALKGMFDEAHRRKYGHASERDGVEVVNLRVAAGGAVPRSGQAELPRAGEPAVPRAERGVRFDGVLHPTPIFVRPDLAAGASLGGPLVVDEDGATTVVPPGFTLTVGDYGDLVITAGKKQEQMR